MLFTRNLGNIVMDLDGVETIELNALGGTDTLTVEQSRRHRRDGRSTSTSPATIGGTAGDGAADTVIVNGTNARNVDQRDRRGHLVCRWPGCRRRST